MIEIAFTEQHSVSELGKWHPRSADRAEKPLAEPLCGAFHQLPATRVPAASVSKWQCKWTNVAQKEKIARELFLVISAKLMSCVFKSVTRSPRWNFVGAHHQSFHNVSD
jgi:hypothetical protein